MSFFDRRAVRWFLAGAGFVLAYTLVRFLFVPPTLDTALALQLLMYGVAGGVAGVVFALTQHLRESGGASRILGYWILGACVGLVLLPIAILATDSVPKTAGEWLLTLTGIPVITGIVGVLAFLYAKAIGHVAD